MRLAQPTRSPRRARAVRSALASLGALCVLAGVAAAGTGAANAAPPPPAAQRVGAVPVMPSGATRLGALAGSTTMHVVVTLQPRSLAALQAMATDVSTPGNALYHHYLTPAQIAAQYGPTPAAVSAVRTYLAGQGLDPGTVSGNDLSFSFADTAGRLAAAFSTSFARYQVGGRTVYTNAQAPQFPGAVAPDIDAVIGLDDLSVPHPLSTRATGSLGSDAVQPHVVTGGPQPCSSAKSGEGLTADQIASAYGFSGLYGAGDKGAGQSVSILELDYFSASDISAFQSCYGTSAAVNTHLVDGGVDQSANPEIGEATLDVETVISLAPKATIDVYEAPLSQTGDYDAIDTIEEQDLSRVVSIGWGLCEPSLGGSIATSEAAVFGDLALEGDAVFAASGSAGSEDCYNPAGNDFVPSLSVDDPGTQLQVTSVGGTDLKAIGPRPTEAVWNQQPACTAANPDCGTGASGGGISTFWAMPSYQADAPASLKVTNSLSSNQPCKISSGICREVPDVSADGDTATGVDTYFAGGWGEFGGTSVSADIWAALISLVNDSASCQGVDVGFANPVLYEVAATDYAGDFNDITSGDNDYTASNAGMYPATADYDMATGLGTPNGAALAAGICDVVAGPTITSLSPTTGSVAGLTTVTITGTHLAETSTVAFGSADAIIDSKSATQVVVTTPAGSGAVSVSVTTPAGTATKSAAFTYFTPPAPTITAASPSQGPTAGGTEVTLTGTNLESVTGVMFGLTAGTVYSDPNSGSDVVVASPAGSAGAPVDIEITTAGGSATDTGAFTYVAPVPNPYVPLNPVRICDTRPGNLSGLSGEAAQCNGGASNPGTTLQPGRPLAISVAGQFAVPSTASAVVLNVTAVGGANGGYVSVYPTDQVPPTASNVNFADSSNVPNLVETGVGVGGDVSIVSNVEVNVAVDLEGYADGSAPAGSGLYNPLPSPARICDTRSGNPSGLTGGDQQCDGTAVAAASPYVVQVTGNGGVPASGVAAVVLNVTVVGPSGQGYLTAYPQGEGAPTASNVNYKSGQTVANRVIVPVSTSGAIDLYASQATNALVDVSGWFSAAGGAGTAFTALGAPARVCDTRAGNPSGLTSGQAQCNGSDNAGMTLPAGGTITVNVTGLVGVPSGAVAVVLNVTAIHPSAQTYLTIYPGPTRPTVSDINPAAGTVKANLVVATVSDTGTVTIFNYTGSVDVAVDVAGYYEPTA